MENNTEMTHAHRFDWSVFANDLMITFGPVFLALLFWKLNPLENTALLTFLAIWIPICVIKAYLVAINRLSGWKRTLYIAVAVCIAIPFFFIGCTDASDEVESQNEVTQEEWTFYGMSATDFASLHNQLLDDFYDDTHPLRSTARWNLADSEELMYFVKDFVSRSLVELKGHKSFDVDALDVDATTKCSCEIAQSIVHAYSKAGDAGIEAYLYNALEDERIMGDLVFAEGTARSILYGALASEISLDAHPLLPLFVETYRYSEVYWAQSLRAPGNVAIAADAVAALIASGTGPGAVLAAGIASIIANEIEEHIEEDKDKDNDNDNNGGNNEKGGAN